MFALVDIPHLGGRVDRDENHVRTFDFRVDVGGEEQVSPAAFLHHIQQPRLVDGQIVRVPRVDLLCHTNTACMLKYCTRQTVFNITTFKTKLPW